MSGADAAEADASFRYSQPLQTLGTSPAEGFSDAWDSVKRNVAGDASLRNLSGAVQDHLDRVAATTGTTFDNPIHSDFLFDGRAQSQLSNTTQALSELAQKRGDPSLAMPNLDALNQQGLEKARAAARLADQQPGLIFAGKGGGPYQFGAGVAGFLGSAAAYSTDPESLMNNVGALALVPAGGGVPVQAMKQALGFGAGQLATTIDTEAYRREITPDRGFADAAKEVAGAAALGAGSSIAGAGLGALWRRARTEAPQVAAALPQPLKDAGAVAERAQDIDAQNPFKTGLTGAVAHRDAIAQMTLDLAEGKAPEAPASALAEAKVPTGQVFLGNSAIDVKYELAEARDLITSHDRNFMVNPAYPAELQPRERANTASRAQVIDMAANLEPSRLGPSPEANAGAPIVGPDNVVESGNGRAMALRNAYNEGTDRAGAYRAFLEQSGYDTANFRQPVLISRRVTAMDQEARARFAQTANASASLRLSPMEQAISDAKHIGPDIIPLLGQGDMGSAGNRDFAQAFVAKLPIGERGGMLTQGGGLSAGGLNRIRAAAFARAYGSPSVVARAFEHPDPNIKTLAGALTDAAPEWVRLKDGVAQGAIPPTHDVAPEIMNAIESIMRARDTGRPVHEILNQGDMFHSDVSGLAARLFFKDDGLKRFKPRADMADALSTVAREIRTSAEAGPDLFKEPVTPQEALEARSSRPSTLFDKELEEIRSNPSLHDAMIADLRRDIDRGDAQIGYDEAAGRPILADAEVHAAEQQEILAKELGNCISGAAE